MKKTPLYILLIVLLTIIYVRQTSSPINNVVTPNKPVVIEPEVLPPLKSNIVYDFEEAKKLAQDYKRNIVMVFGAKWCGYCKDLKADIVSNNFPSLNSYIVCFIDIQNQEDITKIYIIEKIPTSILLDDKLKEWSRKVGYKKEEYELWLKDL
jgi:thioredoxin-related protein